MPLRWILFTISFALLLEGCGNSTAPLPVLSDKFADIQKQTLDKSCGYSPCHAGQPKAEAFLWLDHDSAYNQLLFNHKIQDNQVAKEFRSLVVPFKPDSSYLIFKLTLPAQSNLYGDPMPSRRSKLPQNQIDAIISWIKRGAPND